MPKSTVIFLPLGLCFVIACSGQMPRSAAAIGRPTRSGPLAPAPAPNPVPAPSPTPSNTARLFPSPGSAWLYSAPSGPSLNISAIASGLKFVVNTHAEGFDYPVQYADGSLGCTTFTDRRYYNLGDRICVPNPAGGFQPSVGGWGANDGHLVVVNRAAGTYYDLWKLYTDGRGAPQSTDIGDVARGSLSGNGTPGTTATGITGLAGVILPGELDCTTCLQHALSVVVPSAMNGRAFGHQAPAQKTDGTVWGAIFREGAKLRFDPSINVDALPVSIATKAVLRALQLYGGVITDQTGGSAISFYSALATAPDLTGLNAAGRNLWIYY